VVFLATKILEFAFLALQLLLLAAHKFVLLFGRKLSLVANTSYRRARNRTRCTADCSPRSCIVRGTSDGRARACSYRSANSGSDRAASRTASVGRQ
jgi:hypothetical protein